MSATTDRADQPLLSETEFVAEFRAIGAERYHHKHPFHLLMHEGNLTRAPQAIVPAQRRLLRNSDRQALAALLTAGSQHFAPVLRAHPLEEAMDALTAAVVRLKGAFHGRELPGCARGMRRTK